MRCEDYPCCGHTPLDPCERQWYDEPGAFDTSRNPHALCEHEYGFCDVEPDFDGCDECGEDECVCDDDYDYYNEGREDFGWDGGMEA